MTLDPLPIPGVFRITPKIFGDSRGYFFESWNRNSFAELGIHTPFMQDNESLSSYGVLRGLHYQLPPFTQAKLVRVIQGKVLDIILDIRKNSPTFGQHISVELSGENKHQILIPRGCAHGFAVLSDTAIFAYKCDNLYMPSHERGIYFADPALHIDWQIPRDKAILSERDKHHPMFAGAELLSW